MKASTLFCTGTLVGAGDVISQQLVEQRGLSGHSGRRTVKMMGIGLCFVVSLGQQGPGRGAP